jgi:hypothetical protein
MRFYLRKSVRPICCWKDRRTANEVLPEEVCATNELLEGAENNQKMRFYLRKSVRPMSCWKEGRTTNEVLPEEVCAINELEE